MFFCTCHDGEKILYFAKAKRNSFIPRRHSFRANTERKNAGTNKRDMPVFVPPGMSRLIFIIPPAKAAETAVLFHKCSVLEILCTLGRSLEHFFHNLVLCIFAAIGVGLVAKPLRSFYLHEEVLHFVFVELIEDTFEIDCAARANHKVVLDVKKLDALGIFLEISHGILSAFCAPIYVKFEGILKQYHKYNKMPISKYIESQK